MTERILSKDDLNDMLVGVGILGTGGDRHHLEYVLSDIMHVAANCAQQDSSLLLRGLRVELWSDELHYLIYDRGSE